MVITICIGSSCHLKGSRSIIQGLEKKIRENELCSQIELNGSAPESVRMAFVLKLMMNYFPFHRKQ